MFMAEIIKLKNDFTCDLVNQKEAIVRANFHKMRLLSSKELYEAFYKGTKKHVSPAWSGTLCAYEAQHKLLSNFVQFFDVRSRITYVFEVPSKFVGSKGSILAVNHELDKNGNPLIDFEDKNSVVFIKVRQPSKIKLIEHFPQTDGWYEVEEDLALPIDKPASPSNQNARLLSRLEEQAYVGLALQGDWKLGIYSARITLSLQFSHAAEAFCVKELSQESYPDQASDQISILKSISEEAERSLILLSKLVDKKLLAPIQELISEIKGLYYRR